jgi:hypothetical protein
LIEALEDKRGESDAEKSRMYDDKLIPPGEEEFAITTMCNEILSHARQQFRESVPDPILNKRVTNSLFFSCN